jgi:hypothetical protein
VLTILIEIIVLSQSIEYVVSRSKDSLSRQSHQCSDADWLVGRIRDCAMQESLIQSLKIRATPIVTLSLEELLDPVNFVPDVEENNLLL